MQTDYLNGDVCGGSYWLAGGGAHLQLCGNSGDGHVESLKAGPVNPLHPFQDYTVVLEAFGGGRSTVFPVCDWEVGGCRMTLYPDCCHFQLVRTH